MTEVHGSQFPTSGLSLLCFRQANDGRQSVSYSIRYASINLKAYAEIFQAGVSSPVVGLR